MRWWREMCVKVDLSGEGDGINVYRHRVAWVSHCRRTLSRYVSLFISLEMRWIWEPYSYIYESPYLHLPPRVSLSEYTEIHFLYVFIYTVSYTAQYSPFTSLSKTFLFIYLWVEFFCICTQTSFSVTKLASWPTTFTESPTRVNSTQGL